MNIDINLVIAIALGIVLGILVLRIINIVFGILIQHKEHSRHSVSDYWKGKEGAMTKSDFDEIQKANKT